MALSRTEIADQSRDDISKGTYATGDKLPSYRELAAKFGAAPNTVGEAVRLLAAENLVRIRQTNRAVVCSPEEAEQSEAPEAALRTKFDEARTELHEVRAQVRALDRRISDLLSKLDD